jgi:hypothetical protein
MIMNLAVVPFVHAFAGSDLVRINVLGPVEVTNGGKTVHLVERQRTLLAALALEYGGKLHRL